MGAVPQSTVTRVGATLGSQVALVGLVLKQGVCTGLSLHGPKAANLMSALKLQAEQSL